MVKHGKKLAKHIPASMILASNNTADPYSLRYVAAELARRDGYTIPCYADGDDAIKRDRDLMVRISRDMFMNNAVYRSIINGLTTAIIGEDGFELRPEIKEPYKSILQNKFNNWTKFADWSNKSSFTSMERKICNEYLNTGEVLIIKVRSSAKLQLVCTERIISLNTDKETGEIISVTIKDSSKKTGEVTIKKPDFIFLSNTDRPDQTRGTGVLWSCLDVVNMTMFMLRASIKSMAISSKYCVSIEKDNANQIAAQLAAQAATTEDGEAPAEDEDLEGRYIDLDDSQIFFGKVGEKVSVTNMAGTPNPMIGEHVLTFLRIISSVIGVDAALFVLSDYSKVNYSSSRASNVSLTRTIKRYQSELTFGLYNPIALWLFGVWSVTDTQIASIDNNELLNSIAWIAPRPPIIDEEKENTAAGKSLELGLNSHGDILLARNLDPEVVLQKRKEEIIRAWQITEEIKAATNGMVIMPWENLVGLPVSVNKSANVQVNADMPEDDIMEEKK